MFGGIRPRGMYRENVLHFIHHQSKANKKLGLAMQQIVAVPRPLLPTAALASSTLTLGTVCQTADAGNSVDIFASYTQAGYPSF